MSEGDVNLIRDEDVLRRMWQQTEDFGRKKEIRAHMYRLREERLRNLYSPEPTPTKGCEFSAGQAHVDSFADQTFQSMKSKEVRDAGSPPKEFNYRGQDLKELSNAGWNVESENRTTDDGRTHVKSVNANIEGKYDVEGGRGQFAAVDHQRKAVTEYQDDNSKMRRDESSSDTAAHEHVVRQTDDGTKFSSTISSSNTSSKFKQESSTVHETPTIHDYDQATYDTNRDVKVTRNTKTEQNLRNDFQSGELVSRKIDYPDDNTKVIVETRCLPDGTKVTSTMREFRAPAQSTRSEYQARNESKSYSSQHKLDTRESSLKTIRHMTDSHADDNVRDSKTTRYTTNSRTDDIVDSQRHVDDYDFKNQLREYTVDDDTNSETHRSNRRQDTKISKVDHSTKEDCTQTSYETRINNKVINRSTNVKDDSTEVQHRTNQRYTDNVDQTDRREVIENYDDRSVSHKDVKEIHLVKDTNEKNRNTIKASDRIPRNTEEPDRNVPKLPKEPKDISEPSQKVSKDTEKRVYDTNVTDEQTYKMTRDTNVEENIERKTSSDHYQTTYQTDYQQKKVSNDWSPTHQAWASTLRADTPTTRPSTRASSPGSRTFKSSTSSLRSSVSPDKNCRKPSSRGGSPSKVDRYSPTRSVTSDRYSSTHSSHSVTETRTNKHPSPERRPPTGRSPAGHSPDRKLQDNQGQRPSASPEKRPPNFTSPSMSPERKPSHKTSTNELPRKSSPTRAAGLPSGSRQSPDRMSHQPLDSKTCPDTGYPSSTSPQRSNTSPNRKPTFDNSKPLLPRTSPSPDRKRTAGFNKPEASPERDVGYKQPNPSREPQEFTKRPSVSPDRKPGYMKPTAASQPTSIPHSKDIFRPGDESVSNSLFEQSPITDRKHSKTVIQVKEDHYKFIDEETKMNTRTDKIQSLSRDKAPSPTRKSPSKTSPDVNESPSNKGRSPSPQKKTVVITENDELYGRIDKTVELVDVTSTHDKHDKHEDARRIKQASSTNTPEDKNIPDGQASPTKFGTYDKKKPHNVTDTAEVTTVLSTKDVKHDSLKRDKVSPQKDLQPFTTPTKKSPRDSTSPVKSPTRETKYKHTTDFINTERTTEAVNKKTVTKERPRQLQTPSSSPTRKPKIETEPSTGQSSPTTSVSGFVYFGSPRTEKPIVTDLDDDFEPETVYPEEPEHARPESLDVTKSTSPSKIPCRSPSPEKRESPPKETLPRKSSLKKPSNFVNPVSPIDKPPSSFQVSPTEDKPDITGHKVVKKDHPDEPESSLPIKAKPPLIRRETYEDRCRLILGMVGTTTTENVTKETKKTKKPESDKKSASVSPCDSPTPQESSPLPDFSTQTEIVTKTDVTTFIANEQEDLIKTTKIRDHKSKTPSRESSPTKLQGVISKTKTTTETDYTTRKKDKDVITMTETETQTPQLTPEKSNRRPSESPDRQVRQKTTANEPVSKVPQIKTTNNYPGSTKLPRLSVSPERRQPTPVREKPDQQPEDNRPKETSPMRAVNTTSHNKIITTENKKLDITTASEDFQEEHITKTMKEKSPRTRVLESPTRQIPSDSSYTESQPHKGSSKNKSADQYSEKKSPTKQRESPEQAPGFTTTTTVVSSTHNTTSRAKEIEETLTSTVNKKHKITKASTSPTRKASQDIPRSVSPTKPSLPSTRVQENERSPERKPTKDALVKEPKHAPSRDLPGYMRTTASNNIKNDITITENASETTSSKRVDQKIPSSRPSVSPTRNVSNPRTPSPTKFTPKPSVTSSPKKTDESSEVTPASKHFSPSIKDDVTKKPKTTPPHNRSPTRPATDKSPGYTKTSTSVSSKYETDKYDITTDDTQETITSRTIEKTDLSYEPKTRSKEPSIESPNKKPQDGYPEESSLTCKTSGYKKTTTDITSQLDTTSTTENFDTSLTTFTVPKSHPSEQSREFPDRNTTSLEKKPRHHTSVEDSSFTKVAQDNREPIEKSSPKGSSVSPDRKPSYMRPTASVTSKHETTILTRDVQDTIALDTVEHKQKQLSPRTSPTRQSPKHITKDNLLPKPEEPRQLRTPSPTKKTTKVTEVSTDFLMSEREQEILDRVHKSLRKLSPERKEISPSRERSPNKTTTSLLDLDITTESVDTHEFETNLTDILEVHDVSKTDVIHPEKLKDDKPKYQKITSKPSSRNVSPIKRAPSVPTPQVEKIQESPTKSRSISPRKPLTQTDRPQSPHGTRASGIRPRDQVPFNRKPTPATLSTYKIEKLTDVKKTNGVTKQNPSKTTTTSTTSKNTTSRLISPQATKLSEPETKRIPTPKGIKENASSRKETVTRTSSDSNIKPKKTSPQRMKSKPEIQVNDLSTKSPKYEKPIIKEPNSKLPVKPKSATALNTSTDDDDDIIIDVQQSKSSRENSPDRICPTPVNLADDVSTPRFPDEVSEPDDAYRRRTYHTIHETESVVDDIIEICEDEELFVKKSDVTSDHDDSLLSVNDKVTKFTNKIESVNKTKDTTASFKDNERRVHSDFIDENIKSDECLLSVSEKVNKFAKGPRDSKDNRSPCRKITDEYDRNTIYQDDYTKLSVNDKAHLFVETAENIKIPKVKQAQKVDRPDLSNVEESLKKDDCLLSVSDKVNKFVKTAENFLTETVEVDQKDKKIKEQHEKIIKQIVDEDDETYVINEYTNTSAIDQYVDECDKTKSYEKEAPHQPKGKDYSSPKIKPQERTPIVKITTLRSSEAVKKAKALFENIASTQKNKDVIQTSTKTTKLTDIGVVKKSPKTDSTIVLHPSVEDMSPNVTVETDSEVDTTLHTPRAVERPTSGTLTRPRHPHVDDKPRASPNRLTTLSPEVPRAKSPMKQSVETTTAKTILSRYPVASRAESPRERPESPRHRPESEKSDKVPGYLRPTKTSQIKEETKVVEESEVSSRRGSGKFGVELRKTSIERSTISSERRRSVEHHQPCIEDIFDLDLLEQMLEKVVGYEQRRRIRCQIRVVKNDIELMDSHIKTKHTTSALKPRTLEPHSTRSPERMPKATHQTTLSPDHQSKTPQRMHPERSHPKEPSAPVMNGHSKEPVKIASASRLRPHSPEKPASKSIRSAKSPVRQSSPVKKRTVSPTKTTPKSKSNRFNEYASAYMKKVGLSEADKVKLDDRKTKKATETRKTVSHETQDRTSQEFTTTKSFTATSERTSSRDVIEIVQINGKRSPSPEKTTGIIRKPQSPERRVYSPVSKAFGPDGRNHSPNDKAHSPERRVNSPVGKTYEPERKPHSPERRVYSPVSKAPGRKVQSPERKAQSPERKVTSPAGRLYQRSPSPEFKRQKSDTKKETIIKPVYDIEKKILSKPVQEEKPSWVMNRNLKKVTSETRTFSSKKLETEKPKYRATSPSKVISKPIDVITSSYGPGPLDADGRPLFGIKALRNGATNFQVKGTVIRQEFHSRNGGEPEGTVSVTAYSSQPEELEQLLTSQGVEPPSRIHGIAAITTTKKFGGDTGISMSSVNTKEERASLEHFTHTDRKMDSHTDNLETCSFDTREEIDSRKRQESRSDKRREEKVTEVRKEQKEERKEKMERREDKKTVRQSSVKSLTEKFIKSANDSGKTDRSTYPKAGLILRTSSTVRDSVSSDEPHLELARTDSEHSIGSVDDVVVTTSTDRGGAVTTTTRTSRHHGPTTVHQRTSTVTHHEPIITTKKTTRVITESQEPVVTKVVTQGPVVTKTVTGQRHGATVTERSFLDSSTKVTGVQDILTRMKNADIVIEDGDTTEDSEARALLNKFLGATVLMAGMQSYVGDQPAGQLPTPQDTVRSGKVSSSRVEDIDLDQCWDERLLRQLLDECTDYEQRRRLRARIRSLMAEQEACAAAVTDALGAARSAEPEPREEEEVTVTSSVRRDSSEKTSSSSTTKTSKVVESVSRPGPKPVSPFAKFRQLEKRNSTNSPNSPQSPQSPGSPSQPYFKFTDPALQCSALTIKERLLQWCRDKTRDYENVKLENFSTSWADGLAFCALLHHFLPDAFDYSQLTPDARRHNFTLAFKVADEKAGIYPLLDVDDMVTMRKPDWKCVFTYVQSIHRRFKDEP